MGTGADTCLPSAKVEIPYLPSDVSPTLQTVPDAALSVAKLQMLVTFFPTMLKASDRPIVASCRRRSRRCDDMDA